MWSRRPIIPYKTTLQSVKFFKQQQFGNAYVAVTMDTITMKLRQLSDYATLGIPPREFFYMAVLSTRHANPFYVDARDVVPVNNLFTLLQELIKNHETTTQRGIQRWEKNYSLLRLISGETGRRGGGKLPPKNKKIISPVTSGKHTLCEKNWKPRRHWAGRKRKPTTLDTRTTLGSQLKGIRIWGLIELHSQMKNWISVAIVTKQIKNIKTSTVQLAKNYQKKIKKI